MFEVQRFAAGRRECCALTSLDVREPRPEVEVDAGDVVAGLGEGDGGRLAHPARRAEDQRPALAVVRHLSLPGCAVRSSVEAEI